MLLTRKIKLNISKEAQEYLEFSNSMCRWLYNTALNQRILFYSSTKKYLNVYQQKKELPNLKKEIPEFSKVYNKNLSATLFRLDKAFQSFFGRGCKGFPRFRGKHYWFTLEYPAMYVKKISDKSFVIPTGKGHKVIIAKTKEVIPANFKTINIIKSKGKFFATFTYEVLNKPYVDNHKYIGIDLGIKNIVTGYTTDGILFQYPHYKYSLKALKKIDNIRSKRDKCKKGSRRWIFLTLVLRRENEAKQNRMSHFLNNLSYKIMMMTERNIIIGDLDIQEMITIDEYDDNGKKLKKKKTLLNRYLQNEWNLDKLIKMLEYKSILYGKLLIKIDESYTSKACSSCGNIKKKLKLSDRTYKCEVCGFEEDRDKNSAINILDKYLVGQTHWLSKQKSVCLGNQEIKLTKTNVV